MNQINNLKIYNFLPYLYAISFGVILIPMYLEDWFNLEIFSIVLFMCILIFKFTKHWIKITNFPFLIISFILLICYPLKYAYIYYLISSDSSFIIDTYFDLQQTNYLSISNEQHILFITYVISAFLGLFAASLFTYKINIKDFKLSFNNLVNNKTFNFVFANKSSNYFFLFSIIFGIIIFINFRVGIVSDQKGIEYILPFGLSTILQIIQKYILVIYGFILIYFNKIIKQGSTISFITKFTLYSYILFCGLYTTSKEYLLIWFAGLTLEILFLRLDRFQKKRTKFSIKFIFLVINLFLFGLFILFTIQARLIRNTTLCNDCGGIETMFFLFDFLIENQSFSELWSLLENFNALNINLFNTVLLSTIFRLQGADCLLRIMNFSQSNPVFASPDIFGFFESISTLRESGSIFYADIINADLSLGDAGVAFAPSLLGVSLQLSNSIFNPFIFVFSLCFVLLNLIYLLIKSNFPFDVIVAIMISFEFLKGISEGNFSYIFPLLGIISLLINYLISNNKNVYFK